MTASMSTSSSLRCIRFHLALPANKYLAFYRGIASNIVVRSVDNINIKFPASAVRRFLTHDGIFGLFEIQFNHDNKLIGVKRISQ